MACKLIEQPGRVIIRSGWIWRVWAAICVCFFLAISGGWWLITTKVLLGGWYFDGEFFSVKSGMGLGLAAWFLIGSLLMALLLLLGTSFPTFSIRANGWVWTGLGAWRFPGSMRVRCVLRGKGWPSFELSYGAANFYMASYGSADQTVNCADQLTQWARRRIGGIPGNDQAQKDNFMVKWGWGYFAMLVIGALVMTDPFHIDRYYLNEHAKFGVWAVGAATGFAVVGLAVAGWHWIRLDRREIKASMVIWVMDVLAALLLVAAGCSIAMYFGQVQDMQARPFHGLTLRQPVHYYYAPDSKSCSLSLDIQEPTLGRTISYDVGCDQLSYWKGAAGMEVHQAENELGVHIQSVRRIDPKNSS
ncbi:MAG: hypothetical protein LBH31_00505 [Burkholderiaceae bacterium]|jgi:hypothetical protein|nr:hypothetical protein [Burkholderiaceae bacterium]